MLDAALTLTSFVCSLSATHRSSSMRRAITQARRSLTAPSRSLAVKRTAAILPARSTLSRHSFSTRPPLSMSAAAATPAAASAFSGKPADIWDPTQYLLFDEIRARPGSELVSRIQQTLATWKLPAPRHIVDLGCGPGKQVLLLARSFPDAISLTGIDSSDNMVAVASKARDALADENLRAKVQFKRDSFEGFKAPQEGVDLLYSNAALHWAGWEAHAALFPHLVSQVASSGGILAVQMPNNFKEPSHLCMKDALQAGSFFPSEEQLDAVWAKQPSVHARGAAYYFELLQPLCRSVDAWQVEYQQIISAPPGSPYHPVLEWTKSTALAPVLAALPNDAERTRFQQIYSEMLEKAYPYFTSHSGQKQVRFPFKRIFLVAVR